MIVAALRKQQQYQERARAEAGEKWQEQGIVFSSIYGGFFNPNTVMLRFKQLLKKAGLSDIRFHYLRHSAATILAATRVDLKTIQEGLGHSSIATTAGIYSHVLPKMQQEVVEKIDDLFNGF